MRVLQIASAVKEIVGRSGGDSFPHIICGDFNSPPLSPGYLVARDGYPAGDETINRLMEIQGLQLPEGKVGDISKLFILELKYLPLTFPDCQSLSFIMVHCLFSIQ